MIVLDASAVVSVLLEGGAGGPVGARVAAEAEAAIPELADVEVMHALRRLVLLRQLPDDRAEAAFADLLALPLLRLPHAFLVARAWELRRSLTAYDAIYVALAEALRAPLLTRDARLARSHGHRATIEVL